MSALPKKHIKTIIAAIVIAAALTAAFFLTGSPKNDSSDNPSLPQSSVVSEQSPASEHSPESSAVKSIGDKAESIDDKPLPSDSGEAVSVSAANSSSPSVQDDPVSVIVESLALPSEESFAPSELSDNPVSEPASLEESSEEESSFEQVSAETPVQISSEQSESLECTISVSCETLLSHMEELKKNKRSLVPADGMILSPLTVEINEGESVFDLTKRVCRERGIPFEFTMTPIYNTAYIEGIFNLYEFDCGSGSGWVYTVNGVQPSVGCSDYPLNKGDILEWHYTCRLGKDISAPARRDDNA